MHLIEIFLPLSDNDGVRFAAGTFVEVRRELTEKFGGLTAFSRAPAEGTDTEGGRARHDELVVFEVMTEQLDRAWWSAYRKQLEHTFRQQRILIRRSAVTVL
ncbi:MAG: hypothetical protein QOH32_505 [Bradyrhizobium sp.]|jgi:hypothetical protein|nr:hypothetical protein [Bradyrhizobium sp.]